MRVSACNLMISSRNFDDGKLEWRGKRRERENDGQTKRERGNEGTRKRASERERVCNDGLVRAGLLHTRKISREKQRRVRREEDREIHREEQAGWQAGRAGGREGGRER